MAHWRARDGRILIRDSNDEWHWVTPAHTKRSMHRLLTLIVAIVTALFLTAALLLAYAKADGLPQYGVSCADIVMMAAKFKLHNTLLGRTRAKIIAGTLGVYLSEADIEAAASCLPTKGKR